MARTEGEIHDFRVEIPLKRLGDLGCAKISDYMYEPDYNRRIAELKDRAKETADAVNQLRLPYAHPAYPAWSTKFVCEHCNSNWTERSETYNGGCCDKDEEANPAFPKKEPAHDAD